MDRTQEEAVLRITASYVAELEAGLRPRLSDYLARYPQYANAIADFVAYYHAVEADLPQIDEADDLGPEDSGRIIYIQKRRDAKQMRKVAEGRPVADETNDSIS